MHAHDHKHDVNSKNLFVTIVLNIIITVAQVIGGLASGSLALLSDALHNFSDVMALVIAWWANRISLMDKTIEKTYGYKRAQIVAALFNGTVLVGIGFYLIIEAIERLRHPATIESDIVIYLALLSIILNTASVLLIKDDRHENLNIKAAYLHLITDVMTSVAVLAGGLLIMFYGYYWIDPLVTIVIAIYLIKASYQLIAESVSILMQSTPKSIDIRQIEKVVLEYQEVENIHHVHLWQLDEHNIFLEAHLEFKNDLHLSEAAGIKEKIEQDFLKNFGITHVTLQAEFDADDSKELFCGH